MAWDLLPVNYTDAIWNGLKRYYEVKNEDGTVSFEDVTTYFNRDTSFFGARDANRMNEALNTIMSMVENGTDLYTAFQNYFIEQRAQFERAADQTQDSFNEYVDELKSEGDAVIEGLETGYREEIDGFEENQMILFNEWFNTIRGLLGTDPAGSLQNQVDALDTKTDGFEARSTTFSADGKTITEVYGNKRIETEFVSDSVIVQKLYEGNALIRTKTITFAEDGSINEEVL